MKNEEYRLKGIWFFLLMWMSLSLNGQQLSTVVFDTDDGLPSTETYKIVTDPSGNLWVCTDHGLVRYNSYNFEQIRANGADRVFFSGSFDEDGIGWFVAGNNTYYYYENDSLRLFKYSELLRKTYPGKFVHGITKKGEAYYFDVSSQSICYMIIKIDENGKIDTVDISEVSEKVRERKSIDVKFYFENSWDNKMRYVVKFRKDRVKEHFEVNATSAVLHLNLLDEDTTHRPRLYMIGGGKDYIIWFINRRLYYLDRKDGTLDLLAYHKHMSLAHTSLLIGDELFVGFLQHKGLGRINIRTKKMEWVAAMADLSVTSIMQDLEGNIWCSTLEKGVVLIPRLQGLVPKRNDFNVRSVRVVDDKVYIGQKNGGFGYFDKHFEYHHLFEATSDISLIERSSDGEPVVDGLRVSKIPKGQLYPSRFIRNVHRVGRNIVWFGTFIIWVTDAKTEKTYIVRDVSFRTDCQYPLDSLHLLVAADEGLLKYNYITNKTSVVLPLDYKVNKMVRFREYLLLATLGDGIYVYDIEKNKILRKIKAADGLSTVLANNILVENRSRVWVATNMGINVLYFGESIHTLDVFYVDKKDGLLSQEVHALFLDKGKMYVGSANGLMVLDVSKIKALLHKPVVKIHNMEVVGSGRKFFTNARLSYKENTLLFSFSSFMLGKSLNGFTYQYALLRSGSADTLWTNTNETRVQFTNLNPGNYHFLIRAKSRSGVVGAAAAYVFTIEPHFTQTFWFPLVVGLVLLALVSYLVYRSIKNSKHRQQLNMKLSEAELASLRNQMNPHFVFNALNSIQSFIFLNNAEKANYYLGSFSKMFRDILESSGKKLIRISDELDFIARYLEIEKLRFPDTLNYIITCDPEIDKSNMYIPPLLMQPLIENSVKHGLKHIDGTGLIEVSLSVVNGFLEYKVTDNGKGFDEGKKMNHISRGTQIVRTRLELLNQVFQYKKKAELLIINNRGEGVTAIIYLPLELEIGVEK